MNYRKLGRTGLKVSPLCLGTMQFGWTADEPTSHDILNHFIEWGGNFVDTADVYTSWAAASHAGHSEEIIGRWLASGAVPRHELVLATKVRGTMGPRPTDQGLSRHHILHAAEASLRRLQTDYIDLYQVHFPDAETPLEETLAALDNLVQRGLVRYIGCSNFPAWLLTKALWVSDVRRLVRFESVQPHYNLVHRAEFERELQPLCQDQQIGVIPYSPLAAGFLTGKYRAGTPLPSSARAGRVQERYFSEQSFATLDVLAEVAQAHEATMGQTAVAWVLANPTVSAAIVGANSMAQLSETVGAAELTLTTAEKSRLDSASQPVW